MVYENLLASAAILVGGRFLEFGVTQLFCVLLILFFTRYSIITVVRGFHVARKTNFPIVFIPWHPHSFIWLVFQVPMRPFLKRYLPKFLWDRISLTIYGWDFHEGYRPFDEWAAPQGNRKSFMMVTCEIPELWTWDAEIISQILMRPKDFTVQEFTKLFMDQFGTNILTSNGEPWIKQRRVIAGVINERISKAVFNESIRQTEGLLEEVFAGADRARADTNRMFDMMKKITIHVLSGAGMGASVPWNGNNGEDVKSGFNTNYMGACKTVTNAVAGPIIMPTWLLNHWPSFLSGQKEMRNLGIAKTEFPLHTQIMLDAERQRSAASNDRESRSNIMSQLLQASEGASNRKSTKALTDEEMVGNLFIFTLAGFDTTANTLSYALMIMAKHPEWQEWLFEEIDNLMPPEDLLTAELEYSNIHPRAHRVLAFMFETLRLFPPIIHMVKEAVSDQVIQTSKATYWVPAGTACYLSAACLHMDPGVWRNINIKSDRGEKPSNDDEKTFRPTRWLNPSIDGTVNYFQPPKGSFIPWSLGPRVCPGQKMAQVEFTAVLLTLLRRHRIQATPIVEDESIERIRNRLEATMRKSVSLLTLQMEDIYDITDDEKGFKLRLTQRR